MDVGEGRKGPLAGSIRRGIARARLVLEHHPKGKLLVLLFVPMMAKPSDFIGPAKALHTRLGWFVPLAPAALWLVIVTNLGAWVFEQEILHGQNEISPHEIDEWHYAVWYWKAIAFAICMLVIYSSAMVRWLFHSSMCAILSRCGVGVVRPPLKFYIVHSTGMGTWFSLASFAVLPLAKMELQQFDSRLTRFSQFVTSQPLLILGFCAFVYLAMELVSRNREQGMVAVYGSRKVLLGVDFFALLLLGMLMFLYQWLFPYS